MLYPVLCTCSFCSFLPHNWSDTEKLVLCLTVCLSLLWIHESTAHYNLWYTCTLLKIEIEIEINYTLYRNLCCEKGSLGTIPWSQKINKSADAVTRDKEKINPCFWFVKYVIAATIVRLNYTNCQSYSIFFTVAHVSGCKNSFHLACNSFNRTFFCVAKRLANSFSCL